MNLEVPHQVVFQMKLGFMRMAVIPKYGVMALASLLRTGDQRVPGILSCMLDHKMDLCLV
jgi:hypothetical protein